MSQEQENKHGIEYKKLSYRGKNFVLPQFPGQGYVIVAQASKNNIPPPSPDDPIFADLNTVWDTNKFLTPRKPVSLGLLSDEERGVFSNPDVPRVLDMPIKFPGSEFRIPAAFEQFRGVIERIAHYEAAINKKCFDEYFCYLTVDQGWVQPDTLQREAPCHVDGFQGPRQSKTKINHTYVVSDEVPTTYYIQPFDLSHLDEARHNFFWEMNKIVAEDNSNRAWRPEKNEINLIDAYTVHRGSEATQRVYRTWIRLSFEVRVFDRLGNAHNPLFSYDWEMLPRDIEGLNLVAYDQEMDPSLRVFPWQKEDGTPHEARGVKTKPNLRPKKPSEDNQ